MAELDNRTGFAELLSTGIMEAKRRQAGKTERNHKARRPEPSGRKPYMEELAIKVGVSPNTIKSWMGQMGDKYIPSRIEDGKLFGIIWLLLLHGEMNIHWFTDLLKTTSMPVIEPALPIWVTSCLRKAKIVQDDNAFGVPGDEDISRMVTRLFEEGFPERDDIREKRFPSHNLPARWSNVFIGRARDLEAIRQWMLSPCPVCLINGWGGTGKTAIALEAAYASCGEAKAAATAGVEEWPLFDKLIWVSAELKGLCLNSLLDTIAYQLGRMELIINALNEKKLFVRDALANVAERSSVLLIVDSIDTADEEVQEFIVNLPQGVKALLTSRDHQVLNQDSSYSGICAIQLEGLGTEEAAVYFGLEVRRQIRTNNSEKRKIMLEQLLDESPEELRQMIAATAGNPKAITLIIAHICESDTPIPQLLLEIKKAAHSLTSLFEYLFGRSWKKCDEEARLLWQVLCFFGIPPEEAGWAAAAGLDSRQFHHAVEQLRANALIESERMEGELHFYGHPMVIAYGEQKLSENTALMQSTRANWSRYYLDFLDRQLKREKPDMPYWNFLMGRDPEKARNQWPNLLNLLDWAAGFGQHSLLIELMLRLSHQLGSYNYLLRIEYGLKAADAAHYLERYAIEAVFRIDAVGWACLEINDFDRGLSQIDAGLHVLELLNADDEVTQSLHSLGITFKARFFLKVHQLEQANLLLSKAKAIPASDVVRHRTLLTQGDLEILVGDYRSAVKTYEKAIEICRRYGGERTAESYSFLGIAYVRCQELEKAEAIFSLLLRNISKTNQLEQVHYLYGMAQLLAAKGEFQDALRMTRQALDLTDTWERESEIASDVAKFHAYLLQSS
jgi:LuxR family transcriptional regulator, glucitol operon activator